MKTGRILYLINVLLVLACAGCIYYLSTASYEVPSEISNARPLLETEYSPGSKTSETHYAPEPRPVTRQHSHLQKNVFQSLFTPTPTPTPTPAPPPPKGNLDTATFGWQVSSLEENKATFIDTREQPPEPFEMTVGGPPKEAKDKAQLPVQVQLIAVDLTEFKAILGFEDQRKEIKY
jgi:hypothetical protein